MLPVSHSQAKQRWPADGSEIWKEWGQDPFQRRTGRVVLLPSWVWVNFMKSEHPTRSRSGGGFPYSQGQITIFLFSPRTVWANNRSHLTFRGSSRRHLYESTTQDHIRQESSQMLQWKGKNDSEMPQLLLLKPWHFVSSQLWTQLQGRRWVWLRERPGPITWSSYCKLSCCRKKNYHFLYLSL